MGHVRVNEIKKMSKTGNFTSRGKTVFLHLEISKRHGSVLNAILYANMIIFNVYELLHVKMIILYV